MRLHFTDEWLRRALADGEDDSECAAGCGWPFAHLQIEETPMSAMRAKVKVNSCDLQSPTQERVTFVAVAADKYPADGSDENNSYARWSPSATFSITICNPALIGKYQPGAEYYVDFTPAS